MKTKEKKELHTKSIKELNNMVTEAKNQLANLKMDQAQNKIKDTSVFGGKRKEIAQMLTIIRLKELADIQAREKA